MSSAHGFHVARHEEAAYVKAVGMANMRVAPTLDAFLRDQAGDGLNTVIIDLSACSGMDSTFMGLLIGMENLFSGKGGRVTVVNPGSSNRRLLDMLGVSTIVRVIDEHEVPELAFANLDGVALSARAQAKMMKKAHEELSAISEENAAKFKAFLTALEADLAKPEKPAPPPAPKTIPAPSAVEDDDEETGETLPSASPAADSDDNIVS